MSAGVPMAAIIGGGAVIMLGILLGGFQQYKKNTKTIYLPTHLKKSRRVTESDITPSQQTVHADVDEDSKEKTRIHI